MENNTGQIIEESPTNSQKGASCVVVGVYTVTILWIIGISTIYLISQWLFEQLLFEGSLGLPDGRVLLAAVYGLALLIPLGLLTIFEKTPKYNILYKSWLSASFFVILTLPMRFLPLTAWQVIAAGQIIAVAFYIFVIPRWLPFYEKSANRKDVFGGWEVALIVAGLLWLPWSIWGALGSWVDGVLGVILGLGMGIALALTLRPIIYPRRNDNKDQLNLGGVLNRILLVFITILIFSSGNANIGLQYLFVTIMCSLSIAIVALAEWGRKTPHGSNNWAGIAVLLGVVASFPLIWVDGDELMFVTGIGSGEIIEYSLVILGLNVLLATLMGGFLFVVKNWVSANTHPRNKVFWRSGVGLVWLVGLGCYLILGQPGFYGERLFVVLKDQADLAALKTIDDANERREAVYALLTEHAENSQAEIVGTLSGLGIEFQPYYLVNGIEVNGGPFVRLWLNLRPEVDRVLDSPRLRPLSREKIPESGSQPEPEDLLWNISMIRANKVWEEFEVRGSGVVIGQSDSGVDGDHPELRSSYLGKTGEHDYHWFDPWYGSQSPTDLGGHGTHTLGSILGDQVGVAPDAEWIGCVNLARNLGNPAFYLDCLQFMLAPFPQHGNPMTEGMPSRGANILNNSWGCPEVEGCDAGLYLPAVEALRVAGVYVVVSAGNSGYGGCGTVESPLAIYGEVMTVGAVNLNGDLAGFSSVGPVTVDNSNRIKPDILAPGDMILSAYPGGTYESASGTSMAGPHVAGVIALMWSANPKLIGDIDTTTRILTESAQTYQGMLPECASSGPLPQNGIGYGIVDAYEAVRQALNFDR